MPTLQELTGAASVHDDPQAPKIEVDPAPPIEVESKQELDVLPDVDGADQEISEDVGDERTSLRYKSMLLPANVKDMLKQYDVDGDGSVDIAELLNAAQAHSDVKKESRHQKRMILSLAILFVFLGACLFGSMLAAIEISKETKTEGEKYMVPPGKDQIIATGAAKQEYSLFNLVLLPDNLIETVDKLTYTNEEDDTVMADIQERVRSKDGLRITLKTAQGDNIIVAEGKGTLVKADGKRFPICGMIGCARFSINDPKDEDLTTETRRLWMMSKRSAPPPCRS